jgi:hypothetical protein
MAVPEAHAHILLDTLLSVVPSYFEEDVEEEDLVVDVYLLLVFLILQSYNKPSQVCHKARLLSLRALLEGGVLEIDYRNRGGEGNGATGCLESVAVAHLAVKA